MQTPILLVSQRIPPNPALSPPSPMFGGDGRRKNVLSYRTLATMPALRRLASQDAL